ncbi:hypothetical protein D9Q98_004120 [Chlorella vulgaris]|uniref:Uncharacterized protein n=1 Tax=Chlorella vulgaris TaxID=3077 RepID=A0A9D4TRP6_CHLVU|nr:hypothetical protein D9Q98_004120 [Chlorella vulgaris]
MSARVQLVLNLREEPQEHILKVTAGHEVVEARRNGVPFLFKRKRSSTVAPADAPAAPSARAAASARTKSHLLRTPAGAHLAQQAATAGAAESPYADELELPQALGRRLVQDMQILPEHAPPAERLLAFCSSLGSASTEAAAAAPGGTARAGVLADSFAAFQQALAAALQDGGIRLAAARATPGAAGQGGRQLDEGEVDQADYRVDLQSRKAGLRARLATFQKEEQQWGALLQQVQQLDQHQLTAAAATPTQQPAGDGGPAATAATSAAADVIAAAAGSEGLDAAAAVAAAGAGAGVQAEAELEGGEELAALERLHAGLHCHLSMQVEGVCKLVGDVEEMVGRANRSAQAVQAEYHAEKFRPFPHVNSPARLIRELVRPGGSKAPLLAAVQPAAAAAAETEDKENAAA